MFCSKCGSEMLDGAPVCMRCGTPAQQTNVAAKRSAAGGGMAIGGFICGLVSLCLPVAVVDLLIGLVGLALCITGLTGNRPLKGLAIAGLVISILAVMGALILLVTEPEFYSEMWNDLE